MLYLPHEGLIKSHMLEVWWVKVPTGNKMWQAYVQTVKKVMKAETHRSRYCMFNSYLQQWVRKEYNFIQGVRRLCWELYCIIIKINLQQVKWIFSQLHIQTLQMAPVARQLSVIQNIECYRQPWKWWNVLFRKEQLQSVST
jgi:hypothetical protein